MPSEFWSFNNMASKNRPELLIYKKIGASKPLDKAVTAEQFAEDLRALGDISALDIRINSGGGDVFTAQAIYSLLVSHKATKHVYIDGIAASAASVIAMAGDIIYMPANAMMMIHNPRTHLEGGIQDFEQGIIVMQKVTQTIIATYAAKTGIDEAKLSALMDAETWMTGTEAVAMKFADKLLPAVQVAAALEGDSWIVNGIAVDLSEFPNHPSLSAISNTEGEKTMPTMETILAKLDTEELLMLEASNKAAIEAAVADASTSVLTEAQAAWDTEKAELLASMEAKTVEAVVAVDVLASVTPEVRAVIEQAQAATALAQSRLLQMENERDLATMTNKIAKLDHIPIGADMAPIFLAFAKADSAGFEKVEALLTAANNAITAGTLFSNVGSGAVVTGDALTRLNAKATELRVTDQNLTKEKAFSQACLSNPDLYAQYLKERDGDE